MEDCSVQAGYTEDNLENFVQYRGWVLQKLFVPNVVSRNLTRYVVLDVIVALGDVFSLDRDPLAPPIWVVSAVIAHDLEAVLACKEIFAVGQLANYVDRVSHNDNHFLRPKTLRLAVHGVVCLREPDTIFRTGVQLAQVATTDGLVEGVVDICVGADKHRSDFFDQSAKCRIACLFKRLDCDLHVFLLQIYSLVKEQFLPESVSIITGQVSTQEHLFQLSEVCNSSACLLSVFRVELGHNSVQRVEFVVWELAQEQVVTALERARIVVLGPAQKLWVCGPVCQAFIGDDLSGLVEVEEDALEFAAVDARVVLKTLPDLHDVNWVALLAKLCLFESGENFCLDSLLIQLQVAG